MGPDAESLKQSLVPGIGASDRKYQVYSAAVNAKLGSADLTSITGYSINSHIASFDYTSTLGGFTFGQYGVHGTPLEDGSRTSKLSEELRLSVPLAEHFDLLVGGFYTHEYTNYLQRFLAVDDTTGAFVGDGINFSWTDAYTEYAAFTDLTVHFTKRFDIQFGGRETQSREGFLEIDTGPYVPAFDGADPPYDYGGKVHSNANSFTYLVTPRFKLSDELMVYSRLASGFRAGGSNGGVPFQFNVSPKFGPDKTLNYGLGLKADMLEHRLTLDVSAYYIDWKDMQLNLSTPTGYSFIENTSRAKSEGLEFAWDVKPFGGFSVGGWVAWNEAVVTEPFPSTSTISAAKGDRLPFSPRFSGSISVDQEFPIMAEWRGFVGAEFNYVGARLGSFIKDATIPRANMPSYNKTELSAGARRGAWTIRAFANNLSNSRGILFKNAGELQRGDPAPRRSYSSEDRGTLRLISEPRHELQLLKKP